MIPLELKHRVSSSIGIVMMLAGIALMLINLYGLTQSLRPGGIESEHLRFREIDQTLSQEEFELGVQPLPGESKLDYADRLTTTIAKGLAHIHWERYPVDKFHQRVPIWENFLLYGMSVFTNIPEYDRYHFVSPEKSIERGIGICGDASMLMSGLLDRHGIESKLITVPGHVLVMADIDGQSYVYDPDYGASFGSDVHLSGSHHEALMQVYLEAGHSDLEAFYIAQRVMGPPTVWEGVEHFVTKKYYFERLSYPLKWLIPITLLALGSYLFFMPPAVPKFRNEP